MNKELQIYEVVVDANDTINLVSLVNSPAIRSNFIALADQEIKLSMNDEQRIITGPLLIPNQLIYRNIDNQEFYITFRADVIKSMSESFMNQGNIHLINKEHNALALTDTDAKMIESWVSIDSDKDKSSALGYNLEKGTWFASYKIMNDQLWDDVKLGKFKGFSIEANLRLQLKLDQDKPKLDLKKCLNLICNYK